jgi:hypothetical protein
MSGYHGYSMSNNALAAYDSGLVPAYKVPGVPAALVKAHCTPREWHHASKAYNRVNFYDPAEVRALFGLEAHEEVKPNTQAVAALAAFKAGNRNKGKVYENCHVEWIDWTGSLKRPVATARAMDGCKVTVKGQTATVTLPTGKVMVKRLTTRGFSFHQEKGLL